MGRIGFPLKDLRRRRFQTAVNILSLTFCVAAMISTVSVAQIYGLQITAVLTGGFNIGFMNIFSGFATVITYLAIITGGLMTYFFVSANMSTRVKDVGIIRAIGCIPDQAFGYFASQLCLLVILSCAGGTAIGIGLSYLLTYTIASGSGAMVASSAVQVWPIVEVLFVYVLIALLLGVQPIVKAMKARPAEALFPYYLRGASSKSIKSPLARISIPFKIAYRYLLRRRKATLSTIIVLSLALAATTIASAGTVVASQTTQAYINRGVGENIVVVGHKEITREYTDFVSQPFQSQNRPVVNYLDPQYIIPESATDRLAAIPGVKVDPRIFLETEVHEIPTIMIVEMRYFTIGDDRSSQAVVFGVTPELLTNNWMIDGRTLNTTDKYSIVVGDTLASKILASPFDQRVTVLDKEFQVVGVAFDPLNAGLVVYLPSDALAATPNQTDYNLVLLKIDSSTPDQTMKFIGEALAGTGLESAELNPILDRYNTFFQSLWSTFSVISLFFLIIITLSLFTHMTLQISDQEIEIAMMRALGARPRKVINIMMNEAALLILISGAIGITTGLGFSLVFLIRSPAISQTGLMTAGMWLLLTLGFLSVSSLYPIVRIARKNLASILPKT
jgi:ABC-type antimicrobial peptide transport system permease subunit